MVWWWNQVCMSNGKLCYVRIQCEKLMWAEIRRKFRFTRETGVKSNTCVKVNLHLKCTCLLFFVSTDWMSNVTRDKGNFHKHTAMKNAEEKKNIKQKQQQQQTFSMAYVRQFVYNWRRDVLLFNFFFFCVCSALLLWLLSFEKSFYVYIKRLHRCSNAQCTHTPSPLFVLALM